MSIKDELLLIKGDSELLTAEEVVNWARSHPDSALYKAPEFCGWNEEKAAYEHWLWAARRLIALNIVYEDGERKFVSLSTDRSRPGGGYRDIDDVLRSKTLTEVMLDDALNELARVKSRFEYLKALKPVWSAADKVRGKRAKQKASKQAKLSSAKHAIA